MLARVHVAKSLLILVVVISISAAVIAITFAGVGRAGAQDSGSNPDLEEYRAQLARYFEEISAIYSIYDQEVPINLSGSISQVQLLIQEMNYEDLETLQVYLPLDDKAWAALEELGVALEQNNLIQAGIGPSVHPSCDGSKPTIAVLTTFKAISTAAEILQAVVTESLVSTPVHAPLAVLWGVAAAFEIGSQTLWDIAEDCEQDDHYSTVHTNVDATVSSRATQTSVDTLEAKADTAATKDTARDVAIAALETKAGTAATNDTARDVAIAALETKADTAATKDTARDVAIAALETKSDVLEAKADVIQYTLDNEFEERYVHLQLIETPSAKK